MGNTTTPEINVLEIAGNAPDDLKLKLGDMRRVFTYGLKKQLNTFAQAIQLRLKLTELSIINKAEEPNKLEGRAVLEIDVEEGKWKRETYYFKLLYLLTFFRQFLASLSLSLSPI